jgi:hypothetical protein
MLPDGTALDLDAIVNLANCSKRTPCSDADMDAITADRPWGANNPRWQLYGYGRLSRLAPRVRASSYMIALVADDPSERDGDPLRDAPDPAEPGSGLMTMRIEAFGLRGGHRKLEITLARPPAAPAVRVRSWHP